MIPSSKMTYDQFLDYCTLKSQEYIEKFMNKIEKVDIRFNRIPLQNHLDSLKTLDGRMVRTIKAFNNEHEGSCTISFYREDNMVISFGTETTFVVYSNMHPSDIDVICSKIYYRDVLIAVLLPDEKTEALEKIKILEEELANLKKIVSE